MYKYLSTVRKLFVTVVDLVKFISKFCKIVLNIPEMKRFV